jgi:hypothetical protein
VEWSGRNGRTVPADGTRRESKAAVVDKRRGVGGAAA